MGRRQWTQSLRRAPDSSDVVPGQSSDVNDPFSAGNAAPSSCCLRQANDIPGHGLHVVTQGV